MWNFHTAWWYRTHIHTHTFLFFLVSLTISCFFRAAAAAKKNFFWLCKKEINEHRHKHSASVYMYTHVWLTKKHRMHLIALFLNDLSLSVFLPMYKFSQNFFLILVQESSSTCSCRLQFFFWKNILSFTHLTSHHTKSSETTTKRREIFFRRAREWEEKFHRQNGFSQKF